MTTYPTQRRKLGSFVINVLMAVALLALLTTNVWVPPLVDFVKLPERNLTHEHEIALQWLKACGVGFNGVAYMGQDGKLVCESRRGAGSYQVGVAK